MTNFTVRVELHGAANGQYDQLHEAMEAKGFLRWIENDDGEKYQLPTAEYNMEGTTLTRSQVHTRAKEAANSVKAKPRPSILTSEANGRTWSGLVRWEE